MWATDTNLVWVDWFWTEVGRLSVIIQGAIFMCENSAHRANPILFLNRSNSVRPLPTFVAFS